MSRPWAGLKDRSWLCAEPPPQISSDIHILSKYEECLLGIVLELLRLESPGWSVQVFDISSRRLLNLRVRDREEADKWRPNRDP